MTAPAAGEGGGMEWTGDRLECGRSVRRV